MHVFVSSVSEIKVYIYRSPVGPKRAQQLRFVVQPLMAVGFLFYFTHYCLRLCNDITL